MTRSGHDESSVLMAVEMHSTRMLPQRRGGRVWRRGPAWTNKTVIIAESTAPLASGRD
jgi:hypothetical protein